MYRHGAQGSEVSIPQVLKVDEGFETCHVIYYRNMTKITTFPSVPLT